VVRKFDDPDNNLYLQVIKSVVLILCKFPSNWKVYHTYVYVQDFPYWTLICEIILTMPQNMI
jgi:hypothetical protein